MKQVFSKIAASVLATALTLGIGIGIIPARTDMAATVLADLIDADLGEVVEGYTSGTGSATLHMTLLGNLPMTLTNTTVELTSGDTDKFTVEQKSGGNMVNYGGMYDVAYLYPVEGLPVGDYSVTATLYYDDDGSGSNPKVAIDTATYTLKVTRAGTKYNVTVTDGTADKPQASAGEVVSITANSAPEGKIFKEWQVTGDTVSLNNANSSTTSFTMPEENVSIKAVYEVPIRSADLLDADLGEVVEGYTSGTGSATLHMTLLGNLPMTLTNTTVELTSGDTDKFTVEQKSGGNMVNYGGMYDVAYLYPVEGLPVGDYSVTATLYYDDDGSGSNPKVAIDTATYTLKVTRAGTKYNVTVTDGTADKPQASAGEVVSITANSAPEGKTFKEWQVTGDTVSLFDANSSTTSFTMPEENVSIKAVYEDIIVTSNYTVTFDSNGGIGTKEDETVIEGFSYTLPSASTFTAPSGKEFVCWNVYEISPDSGSSKAPGDVVTINADTTIQAVWKNIDYCNVVFNSNGGSAVSSQTVADGSKATKPADPTKSGYTFGGWYKDSACATAFDFNSVVTADITLYAKWTVVSNPDPVKPDPTTTPEPTKGGGFEDFVERLYTVALGRASEPEGKAFWSEHVGNGDLTGAQCANEFLLSKEFNDRKLTDEQFLEVLYKTFFARDAKDDKDGFSFWMNSLKTQGRDVVVDCFINSEEWCNVCASYGVKSGATRAKATIASENATKFATRLYTECLGREPEEGGLKFWSLGLTNLELTGSAAAHEFFFCKEFNDHNFDNKELITRMYRTFMGREPDDEGMTFWLDSMGKGMTKQQVFDSFVKSPEFTQICKDYAIDRG